MFRQTDATIEAEIIGLAERYEQQGLAGLTALLSERVAREQEGTKSLYLLTNRFLRPLVGNLNRWPSAQADEEGWLNFKLEDLSAATGDEHGARARQFLLRGDFHLLVGRDVRDLESIQQLIVRTLGWGVAVMVVLALIGGAMMSRSMARRIEVINATSREIMSGDLSRRIPSRGSNDDFDKLTENLNTMLDRIESLMEGVKRVSDNIAHDLRTPLARLRNHLEMLKTGQSSNENYSDSVETAIAEADGLLSTFNALLRIARIESKRQRTDFVKLDLQQLLKDVADLYDPLIEEKLQQLELQVDSEVVINGDRDLLFQCIANLLDNAIKYTPIGGTLVLALLATEMSIQIIIADSGPGIPEGEHESVFHRFYRLEESRTTPGNGLGLSLASAVASLHEMTITLQDNYPGLRVILDIPSALVESKVLEYKTETLLLAQQ